jgi:hypothetical protein
LLYWEKRGDKESVRENARTVGLAIIHWSAAAVLACVTTKLPTKKRRNEFVKRIGKKENFDALKIIVFPILLPPFC